MDAVAQSEKHKQEGNAAFKAGSYVQAVGSYTRAIQADASNVVLPLNRAMAYLKLSKFEDAERDCSNALHIQPKNAKALYRRGLARKGLLNYVSAISDLQMAQAVDATNADIQSELAECQTLLQQAKEAAKIKAAKAAAVRQRAASPRPAPSESPVASTSKATIQGDTDPALMREVSTRRIPRSEKTGFAAAKELRQARESRQRSALGMGSTASILAPTTVPLVNRSNELPHPPPSKPVSFTSNGFGRLPATAYDLRLAMNELFEEYRASADWRPAWSMLSSVMPSAYANFFDSSLEPDLLAQILQILQPASVDSPAAAKQACSMLDAISQSPRFDFVSMLLSSPEQQAARTIFENGGVDKASTSRRAWNL